MKKPPPTGFWYSLSILLAAGIVLAWPDLFMFSKVVHLPDWVDAFPDPLIAAWLLLLLPFSFTLPGAPHFKSAMVRLACCAILGPTCGVMAQSVIWHLGAASSVAQAIWVFVTCSLPPAIALLPVVVIRSCYRANTPSE